MSVPNGTAATIRLENDEITNRARAAAEKQFSPYNEMVSNSVNARIASAMSGRSGRSQNALASSFHKPSSGSKHQSVQHGAESSLDTVRMALQSFINKDLDATLQKYVKGYFEPAISNIRDHSGPQAVKADIVNYLMCKMLEEAKKMYEPVQVHRDPIVPAFRGLSVSPQRNVSDLGNLQEPFARYGQRRDSDGDSYSSAASSVRKVRREQMKTKPGPTRKAAASPKPISSTVDLNQIPETTKFMLGSAANKVLGYGSARGRIYVKHPGLFKYVGDQEDKQWLFESRIMTTAGGKAFLVFAEDIRDILRNDDPNVRRGVVTGAKEFTIPGFMLEKVRAAAERSGGGSETRSQTGSTVSSNVSQNSPAPTEEDMEPESEGDSTPPPHAAQMNAMHFMGTHTAAASLEPPFDEDTGSPGYGFFSPLMNDGALTVNDDVFAPEDGDFTSSPSLDSINPTIGTFGGHELGHLDF